MDLEGGGGRGGQARRARPQVDGAPDKQNLPQLSTGCKSPSAPSGGALPPGKKIVDVKYLGDGEVIITLADGTVFPGKLVPTPLPPSSVASLFPGPYLPCKAMPGQMMVWHELVLLNKEDGVDTGQFRCVHCKREGPVRFPDGVGMFSTIGLPLHRAYECSEHSADGVLNGLATPSGGALAPQMPIAIRWSKPPGGIRFYLPCSPNSSLYRMKAEKWFRGPSPTV
jgi:hypothetical protein